MISPLFFAVSGTRSNRRRMYSPESLEDRNLLSSVVAGLPAADVQSGHQGGGQSTDHLVPMKGALNGTATIDLGTTPYGTFDNFGNLVLPVSSTATGHLSHFGRVTLTETHTTTILAATGYKTSSVTQGQATITAANGDQLFVQFSGTGVVTPNGFDDTFTYTVTGGTGRFEDATGHGTILSTDGGVSKPFFDISRGHYVQTAPYVFNIDGVISTIGSNKNNG